MLYRYCLWRHLLSRSSLHLIIEIYRNYKLQMCWHMRKSQLENRIILAQDLYRKTLCPTLWFKEHTFHTFKAWFRIAVSCLEGLRIWKTWTIQHEQSEFWYGKDYAQYIYFKTVVLNTCHNMYVLHSVWYIFRDHNLFNVNDCHTSF